MNPIVYLNQEYIAAQDAKISIFDRAVLFGDAIYEVIPVYKGRVFLADRHIARLHSSLNKARISIPPINWLPIFAELIQRNGSGDMQIYIQISRGNQGIRKHDIPTAIEPTVFAFTLHNSYPTPEGTQQGLHAKIIEDTRWLHCDIKTTSLLANVLLNDDAVSDGYDTALLTRQGYVSEGSASNVFIVNAKDEIITPPLNNLCLPGITRQITLELLDKLNWPVREEPVAVQDLFSAHEIWITSTTKEIYPITRINDYQIGDGEAGKLWRQIHKHYQQLVKTYE